MAPGRTTTTPAPGKYDAKSGNVPIISVSGSGSIESFDQPGREAEAGCAQNNDNPRNDNSEALQDAQDDGKLFVVRPGLWKIRAVMDWRDHLRVCRPVLGRRATKVNPLMKGAEETRHLSGSMLGPEAG